MPTNHKTDLIPNLRYNNPPNKEGSIQRIDETAKTSNRLAMMNSKLESEPLSEIRNKTSVAAVKREKVIKKPMQ